jgi:hypothetical protein
VSLVELGLIEHKPGHRSRTAARFRAKSELLVCVRLAVKLSRTIVPNISSPLFLDTLSSSKRVLRGLGDLRFEMIKGCAADRQLFMVNQVNHISGETPKTR